jgi:hypothetical protein
MANAYKHKRYFEKYTEVDATTDPWGVASFSKVTHSGTATEAYNSFSFPAVWDTNSPTKTYALEDSGQTLVVTYEFDNASDQTGWYNAIESAITGGTIWNTTAGFAAKCVKVEWLAGDGTTVDATDNPGFKNFNDPTSTY